MDTVEVGRQLAERHQKSNHPEGEEADLELVRSLLNYAEVPYEGDWTLRSALMRLAQPHPTLVGSVLDLSRRLDAPLHHVKRALEAHVVMADRAIDPDGLSGEPTAPYADVRTADLARLVAVGCDQRELLAGYEQVAELQHEERLAVPLLVVAVAFERVSEIVAGWALVGPKDPPVPAVEACVQMVASELDRLGVPEETGPPAGSRRGSRG